MEIIYDLKLIFREIYCDLYILTWFNITGNHYSKRSVYGKNEPNRAKWSVYNYALKK